MERGMGLKSHVSIKTALDAVARNPVLETDEIISLPAHELVCRTLFEIANDADSNKRGSQAKANLARKLIFDRMVGKRKSGSHPATSKQSGIEFTDLTGRGVEA